MVGARQEGCADLFRIGATLFTKPLGSIPEGTLDAASVLDVNVETFVCQLMTAWEAEHERVRASFHQCVPPV